MRVFHFDHEINTLYHDLYVYMRGFHFDLEINTLYDALCLLILQEIQSTMSLYVRAVNQIYTGAISLL